MTGSPEDLIPHYDKSSLDKKSNNEERQFNERTLDKITKNKVMKKIWSLLWFNYVMMFLIVIWDGFDFVQFTLDTWVLVSLIGGVMGSSTVYVIKRSVDFAYSDK